jgi:hypothetical protein
LFSVPEDKEGVSSEKVKGGASLLALAAGLAAVAAVAVLGAAGDGEDFGVEAIAILLFFFLSSRAVCFGGFSRCFAVVFG